MLHRTNSTSNVQYNNTLLSQTTQSLLSSTINNNNGLDVDQQQIQPHQLHTSRLTPPPNSVLKISRYEEDFCEIEKVGKGGYGSVFKVQNRLDGLFYALKKIPFKNTTQTFLDKVLREVKTLASLNHRNIVRYHSAWLETDSVPLGSSNNSGMNARYNDNHHNNQFEGTSLFDGNWGTSTFTDPDSPPFEIDGIDKKLKSPLNKSSTLKKSNLKKQILQQQQQNNKNHYDEEEEEDEDGYDHSLNKLQFPPDFEEDFRQFGKQASIRESMFAQQEISDDESNPNTSGFGFYKNPSKKKSGSTFSLDSFNSKNSEFTEMDSNEESIDDSAEQSQDDSEEESEEESDNDDEEEEEEEESLEIDSSEEEEEEEMESETENGYLNSDDEFSSESESKVDKDFIPNPKLITSTTPPISMPTRSSISSLQPTPTLISASSSSKKQQQQQQQSTSPPKNLYRLTTLYIVMQLYSQTLGQWLENRPHDQINEVENLNIFKQICIGLRYIHSKGIIHRDLKPGNIFLVKTEDTSGSPPGYASSFSSEDTPDEFGDLLVSLGDFGLAVQQISSTSPTPSPTPTSTPSLTPVNSQMLLSTMNSILPLGSDSLSSSTSTSLITSVGPATPSLLSASLSSSTSSTTTPPPQNVNSLQSININNSNNTTITPNMNNLSSSSSANITGTSLSRSMEHFKHTSAVGTMTYSSPEQKKGLYNEKTDIYSLGIILFELFYQFSTKMEKARVLSDLRNRILPKTFLQNYPKIADLVLSMMKSNPDERPSATDILKSEIFGQIRSVSEMEFIIKHQQNIIEQLKQQIFQLKSPTLLNQDDVIIF